jgi:hypothetical protein
VDYFDGVWLHKVVDLGSIFGLLFNESAHKGISCNIFFKRIGMKVNYFVLTVLDHRARLYFL